MRTASGTVDTAPLLRFDLQTNAAPAASPSSARTRSPTPLVLAPLAKHAGQPLARLLGGVTGWLAPSSFG